MPELDCAYVHFCLNSTDVLLFAYLFQLLMVLSPVGMTMAMAVAVGSILAEVVVTMGTATSGSGAVRTTATTTAGIT